MRATLIALVAFLGLVGLVAAQQPLQETKPSLAQSPAAAAYDKSAAAPAPATTGQALGAFYAASPGGSQKLAELGDDPSGHAVAGDSIYNVLKAQGKFNYLIALVDKAGLAGTLADPNAKITLLAPNDAAVAAFAKNAGKSPEDLVADKPEIIKALLVQHVIDQGVAVRELADKAGQTLPTKGIAGVKVESTNPVVLRVAGGPGDDKATVERGVMTTGGGHIITVNRVLLPPMAALDAAGP